jgi:5-methylcytosine-specific restriction endonuclease McrA
MDTTRRTKGGRKPGQGSKWIRPEKRARLYHRDGHACVYCGASIYEDADLVLTLDHVVPCELGGENHHANLVTACLRCNSAKRDLSLRAFLQTLADRGHDSAQVARRVRNARRRALPRVTPRKGN